MTLGHTARIALVGLGVGLAIGATMAWRVTLWAWQAETAEAERALREELEREVRRGNDIVDGWAAAAEELRRQARAREIALRRELDAAIYRACVVPDSGGVLLDGAVEEANRARSADAAVPRAAEAWRADDGRPSRP